MGGRAYIKYEPTKSYNTNEEFRKDVTGRSMNVIRSSNGIIAINLDDSNLAFRPVVLLRERYVRREKRLLLGQGRNRNF